MENQDNRPFELRYQEAKKLVYSCINECLGNYKIPNYLMTTLISDILHQLELAEKEEITVAASAYNQQMQAEQQSNLKITQKEDETTK